jgi:hypothetical protein
LSIAIVGVITNSIMIFVRRKCLRLFEKDKHSAHRALPMIIPTRAKGRVCRRCAV